jgi:hypothetical protein
LEGGGIRTERREGGDGPANQRDFQISFHKGSERGGSACQGEGVFRNNSVTFGSLAGNPQPAA